MGYLIAFEGLDKSGKQSATTFVKELLESRGYKVKTMSFPRYDTPVGKLIRGYLTGQLHLDDVAFETLQATDKLDAQKQLSDDLATYDYVLCDRYIHSQFAYGMQTKNCEWLEKLLEDVIYPDLVIYMDVDVETSMSRTGEHGPNDKYESNKKLLESVKENYEYVLDDENPMMIFVGLERIEANKAIDFVNLDLEIAINDFEKETSYD